jgi:lactate dehydrogenase-like 2-hydroxyacid dehydrogenase
MIDLAACKEKNVTVCNVSAASNESVAEHAIALFFAVRRNVVAMHEATVQGEQWPQKGSLASLWPGLPGTCREEVMGVLGGGELGGFHLLDFFSSMCVCSLDLDRMRIRDSS